ncbi:diacylglycerol kinase catalytic region [Pseudarthrobacter chlorophenolicus A6]|uniref:Diacylglycerol kinase catalytic region n=1 Tax=Pseudarthrobacter chlorophenolicus (strain ATCC 700700 / DSM 12829 / CIP 107037 / JCM 12360 / KCTC 9906 / NCIMB 13794 / A6) TaxID=452863 RepID=B8HDY7_PSECP|nr:lipid kinase [Pseudarthrobacter chlorophenolicus]ACL40855.1 diacylglycerol kinase catalytic region [Pseudarthrobacter chlorophenolicus A6]SDQ73929.1 lipid kinase, YegS/Rv2252/BmrU family [Pseudarthrobacter chlorophenolicus]
MKAARDAQSVAVVINAGARLGAVTADQAVDMLRNAGLPITAVHKIQSGTDLALTLERVMAENHDLVVVGGGDGTVSFAAGRLAGTGTVLGVLPLGTANDLARTLEIPSTLPAACAALADGKVVDIDLGRVNGQPFLNVASVGLSVGVTETLSPRLKRRLGPLAYVVAAVRAYARHQPFQARLEFPGGDHPAIELENLLQVAVGNGKHYGGGNAVSPTAGIDDHTLDIYAIPGARLREHVRIARLLKDGSFVERSDVHHATTQRVLLVTDPPMPVNLDGEIATVTPADFTVERNAVHVVVPQNSTAAVLDG